MKLEGQSENMKIIQVCPRFFPDIGGIETHVYEISKRLAKDSNNEVYVYTTDPTGKLPKKQIIDGIHVRRFKSFAPNEAYFFSLQLYCFCFRLLASLLMGRESFASGILVL